MLTLCLAVFCQLLQAAPNYSPPDYCTEWRADLDFWGPNDYVRWDRVVKHELINTNYNNVAHGARNYTSSEDYVHFFSGEDGYIGLDRISVSDGDANKYYNFADSGEYFIWIIKDGGSYEANFAYELCVYTNVYSQIAPTAQVTKSQTVEPDRVHGTLYFSGLQDGYYSKNAVDLLPIQYEVQSKIIARWTGQSFCEVVEESASWSTIRQLSSSMSMSFSNIDCMVDYRVRSYDGTYYSPWVYTFVYYSRGSSGGGACTGLRCAIEP